ncbi:MAG TPA: DUF2306 domain-containing protein [Magnetospirillaceae bacterium]|nr:DUF2306 domain-containing protein [Magnetospirillaceae bacterium]
MSSLAITDRFLTASARFWFLVALAGQLIFAVHIAVFYGRSALNGTPSDWNRTMFHGYSPDTPVGNGVVVAHLLVAFLISFSGALQLVPMIRQRVPRFHRWNGRVFVVSALIAAFAGLYMVWVRGSVGDVPQHIGLTLNALFMLAFAGLAWRSALARDFKAHRRWALRLFVVTAGPWFNRLGLFLWLMVNQGPAGFDPDTFVGPFLTALNFAQTLLPLAVLELYLRAKESGAPARASMAGGLLLSTLVMASGIFAATIIMWIPFITVGKLP